MIKIAGMIEPAITPNDPKRLEIFSPSSATNVVPQKAIIITPNMNHGFAARSGVSANASASRTCDTLWPW